MTENLVIRLSPLLFSAALICTPAVHAAEWGVDAEASTLGFSGTAEGLVFEGAFKQFSPKIQFDPADFSSARFEVEIALASADTHSAERDETLRGSDFFATRRFPTATYTATIFRDLGDGNFAADGSLSLRGVEKPVTLEFSWKPSDGRATLDGSAMLKRLDFEIGAGDWANAATISHEIAVKTHLELTAQ